MFVLILYKSSKIYIVYLILFYLFIIISAIIVMISTFREKRIEKKQMQETEVLTEKSEK